MYKQQMGVDQPVGQDHVSPKWELFPSGYPVSEWAMTCLPGIIWANIWHIRLSIWHRKCRESEVTYV